MARRRGNRPEEDFVRRFAIDARADFVPALVVCGRTNADRASDLLAHVVANSRMRRYAGVGNYGGAKVACRQPRIRGSNAHPQPILVRAIVHMV